MLPRSVAKRPECSQRQVMLRFEDLGQQPILALAVIVERPLGHLGRGGDLVHAHAAVATSAKQRIGGVKDPTLRAFGSSGHRRCSWRMYTA